MPDYAVRLRAPARDLLPVCDDWAAKCEKVLMYEHTERADNLHCHFLLVNVRVTTENLKQAYKKLGLVLKGPGQVSFKTTYKTGDNVTIEISEPTHARYITYMTKGIYQPQFNKGFDPAYLEACRLNYKRAHCETPDDKHLTEYSNVLYEYVKGINKLDLAPRINTMVKLKLDPESILEVDTLPLHVLRDKAIQYAVKAYNGHVHRQSKMLAQQIYQTYAYAEGKIESNEIVLPGDAWKPPQKKSAV